MTGWEAGAGPVVGSVLALYRFPVKSTAGESLASVEVGERGLRHDREWAVYTPDGGIASGKTTRRFRRLDGLLAWRSTTEADYSGPALDLHGPDGGTYHVGEAAAQALTRAFGRPLTLARESGVRHHDECPVHVVTTASIRRAEQLAAGQLDARRLRANIVLAAQGTAFVEDSWAGGELRIGPDVVLGLGPGMPRCVMVDRPSAGVPAGAPALTALGRGHDTVLGLQASVLRTGTVRIGDAARLSRPM